MQLDVAVSLPVNQYELISQVLLALPCSGLAVIGGLFSVAHTDTLSGGSPM
jgi:hypothetical protein